MIKALLFDNGGVMTAGGTPDQLPDRLAKHLDISSEAAADILRPYWDEYSKGSLAEPALWKKMEAAYGKPISPAQRDIWNYWWDMQPFPEMVELVTDLKQRGYVVGMLSNVIPNTAAAIRAGGGYDLYDFVVLSSEVGFVKPQPEIYQLAMDKLPGISPQEVILLDDQERCLVPARELGMLAILVESPAQAITDVQMLINT